MEIDTWVIGKMEKGMVGIYRDTKGNIYEGNWKNNLKDGEGILVYNNNDRYEESGRTTPKW